VDHRFRRRSQYEFNRTKRHNPGAGEPILFGQPGNLTDVAKQQVGLPHFVHLHAESPRNRFLDQPPRQANPHVAGKHLHQIFRLQGRTCAQRTSKKQQFRSRTGRALNLPKKRIHSGESQGFKLRPPMVQNLGSRLPRVTMLKINMMKLPGRKTAHSAKRIPQQRPTQLEHSPFASGEWIDETTFIDVTLWARTAEIASEYLNKGSSVLIEGGASFEDMGGSAVTSN
jgi:hypothetical protein